MMSEGRFSNLDLEADLVARLKVWPDFFRLARRQRAADVEFGKQGSDELNSAEAAQKVRSEKSLDEANSISSEMVRNDPESIEDFRGWHIPVLDLDFDAALIPSTTPGHFHLILDKPMSWDDYRRLLDVLGDVGILEPGFVGASKRRKSSWIRTPWTRKGES
jgi:hypothetical protein